MSHVFISYSKRDVEYVRQLVQMLRSEGFDVWIDDRNLRSSEDWWQSIVLSIRACSAMIIVLTPSSDASSWVQREITLAEKYNKPTYPLWLEGSVDTPNWELFVRTQFHDVRGGKLPGKIFIDSLALHVTRNKRAGKDVTTTAHLPPVNMTDDHIYREAIENPPSPSPTDLDLTQRSFLKPAIAGVIVVIIGILGALLLSQSQQTSLEPTPIILGTELPTNVADVELTESNFIKQMNTWRSTQNPALEPLVKNMILDAIAKEQGSYLYGVAPTDLQNIREHLFLGMTAVEDVAAQRDYGGEVAIFVEFLDEGTHLTLDDAVTILERRGVEDVFTRYAEVGISLSYNPVTTKQYFVLVLGNHDEG